MVNLMLKRADKNVFEPIEIFERNMRMAKVGSEEKEDETEHIDPYKGEFADRMRGQKPENASHGTQHERGNHIVQHEFDWMDPILRNRIEHRGRMMHLMKFPKHRDTMHEVMNEVGAQIVGNRQRQGVPENDRSGR